MSESASAWVVRIPTDFLDSRTLDLTDRQRVMALILDGMARDSALCIPGNAKLAAISGRTERVVQDILDELEAAGRIRRVYADAAGLRRARVAILLLERVDPKMPRVPKGRADEAAGVILECRKQHTGNDENSMLDMMKTALAGMLKTAPEVLRIGIKTKGTTTKITGSSSSSSHEGSQGRVEGSQEQASVEAPTESDVVEVIAKATSLFDGSGIPARATKLCRDFGKDIAMDALEVARSNVQKDRDVDWAFVIGTAKNKRNEGGATGKAKKLRPSEINPPVYHRADPTRPRPTPPPSPAKLTRPQQATAQAVRYAESLKKRFASTETTDDDPPS